MLATVVSVMRNLALFQINCKPNLLSLEGEKIHRFESTYILFD